MRERLCDTLMRMAGRLPEWEPWPKAPEGALKPPGKRPDPRPKDPAKRTAKTPRLTEQAERAAADRRAYRINNTLISM